MKISRSLIAPVATAVVAPFAHAHPGHDGHELTWDFHGHGLWDSPITLAIGALLTAAALYYLRRRRG